MPRKQDDGLVEVTLKRSVGIRNRDGVSEMYGPGTVKVPKALAEALEQSPALAEEDGQGREIEANRDFVTRAYPGARPDTRGMQNPEGDIVERTLRGATRGKQPATDSRAKVKADDNGGDGNEADYESMTVDELKAEADERGVEVKASNESGSKVKADYVKALKKADRKAARE